jgi:cytochrome c-type biogenesis protein
MGFLRRHTRTIQLIGAISLIVLGLLMLTGLWGTFIAWLQGRIAGVGTVL